MKLADVRRNAFAMPLNDPAYPPGPYKFYNREFVVITYRTDPDQLREVVPEPLEVAGDTVAYEFIRMPDSTGFGDYTETGQVIPVRFKTKEGAVQDGGYVHAMYLDDEAPIASGREIWGFPKKLASPKITHEGDVVVCTLHYGSVLCVSATWVSSIAKSTRRRCSRHWLGQTSWSKSSRMSTAPRGSANLCAITWKTSP